MNNRLISYDGAFLSIIIPLQISVTSAYVLASTYSTSSSKNGYYAWVSISGTYSAGHVTGFSFQSTGYNFSDSPGIAAGLSVYYECEVDGFWYCLKMNGMCPFVIYSAGYWSVYDSFNGPSVSAEEVLNTGSSGYIDSSGIYHQQTDTIDVGIPYS